MTITASSTLITVSLLLLTSALLVVTGLRKQPGIGVIGTLIIIALALWFRDDSLAALGFQSPENWGVAVLQGLGLGFIIQMISITLVEPLSERITHTTHDLGIVENVKGDWKALLQWLLIVWVFVAVLEEGV